MLAPGKITNRCDNSRLYRVFDLCLRSDILLPVLVNVRNHEPDLMVSICPDAAPEPSGFQWFHEWVDNGGKVVIAGARRNGEFLLRFPNLADFSISASLDTIKIFPAPDAKTSTLGHLLIDQVLPRILNQQGNMVIHASAVTLPDGAVVAFLGNTGRGKSTLASSFYSVGCGLVSDDCLLVFFDGPNVLAFPAYSSLRLLPDSMHSLFPDNSQFHAVAEYSEKLQIKLPGARQNSVPLKLSAMFILGDSSVADVRTQPLVCPAQGKDQVMAVIESMFALDIDDPAIVQQNFRLAGALLSQDMPVYRLEYARNYDLLPAVRKAVQAAVAEASHGD